jgi:hypothetical protein
MEAPMNPDMEPICRIEEALKAVHHHEAEFKADPAWESNVMREIRRIGIKPITRHSSPERYGQLVWRFSALTCLLALALTVYAVSSDLSAASEVANLFFEDPLAVLMVQSLGVV